ncbi:MULTISPECIES: DUF3667 domain-containing protein [unclassified Pseudoxanthomonas]|uniref:DUF3667 domain-containing protein n=1 Tax=unclassified Pseudoxanthomonas TaxID=2645906 RepID=UPI003077E44C
MSQTVDLAHASACENCETTLQGGFCHLCGQNAHSPLRHTGHALEEVFESFWHLDGRVFRTLRELLSPGRLANAYLAGHRVRYIAPLRLFVILSVLTFFVAQYVVHFTGPANLPAIPVPPGQVAAPGNENAGGVDFQHLKTAEEVLTLRDETVGGLLAARATLPPVLAHPRQQIEQNIRSTQARARQRVTELQPDHPMLSKPDLIPEDQDVTGPDPGSLFSSGGKRWHPTDNPVHVTWLPDLANRWLNKKLARAQENLPRMQRDPELFKEAFIGAVPSALFVLVPVFALLLKLGYLGSRRSYLEHLVVALYSHAWLCLALLSIFALNGLGDLIAPYAPWLGTVAGFVVSLVVIWMPGYLLLMQKRVYQQSWWITIPKYLVLGSLYFTLVVFAGVLVVVTSFVGG